MSGAPRVVVVGEALVDLAVGRVAAPGGDLPVTARVGGSPANVAVGLARLDVPTAFAGRIEHGGFGPLIRAHLEASGLDLGPSVAAVEPTTLAVVSLDEAGAATYSFSVRGTADWQWTTDELPRPAPGTAVHTGSLAIGLQPGAAAIAAWWADLRARGDVLLSLDPNIRPQLVLDVPGYRDRLASLVAGSHLVKVSEDDLRALAPAGDPLARARAWAELGPELVVVTHGAAGATALRRGHDAVHVEAEPVRVVDTVGAGDSFTSALLAHLDGRDVLRPGFGDRLDDEALAGALSAAARAAALTCGRAGADPPWRSELGADR